MAGFFDEEDVVQVVPPPAKKKEPATAFFDAEDTVSIVQPVVAQSATTPTKSSFFDEEDAPQIVQPSGEEGQLTTSDIDKIAAKYGVSAEDLKNYAPYYGAKVQPSTPGEALKGGLKETAGFAGRTIGLGVPQFAYKKLQDPAMQKALDELTSIGREQQTGMELAAELVAPGGLGGAATKAGRLAKAAGMGAIIGTTGSETGKEAESALRGAAIGGALGGAAETVGIALSRFGAGRAEKALAELPQNKIDLDETIQKVAKETEQSEKLLNDLVTARKEALSSQDADIIVREQMSPEKVDAYLNPATREGKLIRSQLGEEASEDLIKKSLADDILENRIREFAAELTDSKPGTYEQAYTIIEEVASRQGQEAIANKYQQFVQLKQAERGIEELGLRATETPGFVGKTLNQLSDNQFVLRGLDRKYGTKLEGTLRELNKDFNRSTFAQKEFRSRVEDVFQTARKNGTDEAVIGSDKIYKALDTGDLTGLTKQELETADKFRQYFADVRDFVNGKVREKDPRIAPLSIPKRENYVPKQVKAVDELVTNLENKMKEAEQILGGNLSSLSSGDLATLIQKEGPVKDLYSAVTVFDNRPVKTGAELTSRLKEMLYSRKGNIALETEARAALERKGVIPDFMLEKDLYKLARKYADNTLKHLYLRNNIDRLRYQAKQLDKLGADVEADYIRNIVRDLMGVRQGTAAEATMQARIGIYKKVDDLLSKTTNPVARGALIATKAMPEVMSELARQIYPNLLGYWNIRAVLQNATQGITKTAPELGTKYGYATLMRAAALTVKDMARLTAKAEKLGNKPSEFIRDGERAIAEGIRRTAIYEVPAKVVEGMGKTGMVMFTKMEDFNRALVVSVAETMARDLARGSKFAQESLKKFPISIQKEIARAPEATEEILAKYLNNATMYNYNRAAMSEFGRTMGPLFSAFSKWPTATLGEVVEELRSKGALKGGVRLMEKLMGPFLLLQGMDYLMGERLGEKDSLSDVQKKIIGSGGLSQAAPIGSLKGVLAGEIFTPPAADAFIQTVVAPIMDGKDTEDTLGKMERGAGTTVMNFTPTAGLFRFLFDDIVTYTTGERPEGNNPTARVIEGMRQAGK